MKPCSKFLCGVMIVLFQLSTANELLAQYPYSAEIQNVSHQGLSNGAILIPNPLNIYSSFQWSNGDTSNTIYNLTAGDYYLTLTDTASVQTIDTFKVGVVQSIYHFPWTTTPSVNIHNIQVPGNPHVQIRGTEPLLGDSIGVFYDSLNHWACAGFITWTGFAQTIQVYGDTSGNAGFETGEEFRFLIRSQLFNMDFYPLIEYDTTGILSSGLFNDSATSNILSMNAADTILHSMLLVPGVNIFSLPYFPIETHPAYYFNFGAPCQTTQCSLVSLLDQYGGVYYSYYGLNTISLQTNTVYSAWNGTADFYQNLALLSDSVTASIVQNTCYNLHDGVLEVNPYFGIPPYTYNWSGGQSSSMITDIQYGDTYSITITDNQSISVSREYPILVENNLPDMDIQMNQPNGYSSDGSIAILMHGLQPGPVNYAWSTGSADTSLTNLSAGIYSVSMENGNGCMFDTLMELSVAPLTINVNTTNSVDNLNNGTASAIVSGGFSPYSYMWSNGSATSSLITNLAPGIYSVTVTDDAGVSDSSIFQIYNYFNLTWSYTTTAANHSVFFPSNIPSNILGNSLQTGDLIGAFYTGSSGLKCAGYVEWDGGPMTANIWGDDVLTTPTDGYFAGETFLWYVKKVSSGQSFQVNVVYDSNYPNQEQYVDNGSSAITGIGFVGSNLFFTLDIDSASCYGYNDGSASIVSLQGLPPYQYQYSTGVANDIAVNMATGFYSVTVTDGSGTSSSLYFMVHEPEALLVDSVILENVTPGNWMDGSIEVFNSGGIEPYDYSWSNLFNTPQVNNLIAGIYSLTLTDNNGCVNISHYTIDTVPNTQFYPYIGTSNVTCNAYCDGAIDLNVYGGTPPYSYNWSNGQVTQNIDSLCPGFYDFSISDAGDTTSFIFTTTAVTHVANVLNNGSITLEGQAMANGDIIGAFYEDAGILKCGGSKEIIGSSNAIILYGDDISTGTKEGFSIGEMLRWKVFQVSTGKVYNIVVNYAWGPGTGYFTVNGSSPFFSATDTAHTQAAIYAEVDSVEIIDYNLAMGNVVITSASFIPDGDGAAMVTATGGTAPYSFIWALGDTSSYIANLASGWHSVSIQDSTGCSISDSVYIDTYDPAPLSIAPVVSHPSNALLNNGEISLTVSGSISPYSYNWSNGDTTASIDSLHEGIYEVTVSSSDTDLELPWSISGNFPDPPKIITNYYFITINGNFAATGDYIGAFYLDNGNLHCGGYQKVTPGEDFDIHVYPDDTITPQKDGFILNDTVYWRLWRAGDDSIVDLTINTYGTAGFNGYVYDTTGSSFGSFLGNYTQPFWYPAQVVGSYLLDPACDSIIYNAFIIPEDTINGSPGSIDMEFWGGVPPYEFNWSNGQNSEDISGLNSGTYSLYLHDLQYCVDTLLGIFVPEAGPLLPLSTSSIITNPSCYGFCDGLIHLDVTGGYSPYTYIWSNDSLSQSINNLCDGEYCVTISSGLNVNPMPWSFNETTGNSSEVHVISAELSGIIINGIVADSSDYLGVFYGDIFGNYHCGGYKALNSGGAFNLYPDDPNTPMKDGFYDGDQLFFKLWRSVDGSIVDLTITSNFGWGCLWTFCAGSNWSLGFQGFYSPPAWSPAMIVLNFTVTEPDTFSVISNIGAVDPMNGSDGSIELNVTGGTSPYAFEWSSVGSTGSIYGLTPGWYTVTITDQNSCSTVDSFYVDYLYAPIPLVLASNEVDVLCFGDCNGSIDLQVSGGALPYTYSWSNGFTTENIFGICAGEYLVTVISANHDTAFWISNVAEPDSMQIDTTILHVSPASGIDGEIDISVNGGTSPFVYAWSTGATTQDITGLGIGTYTVSISDGNLCDYEFEFVLIYNSILQPLSITTIVIGNPCHGDCLGEIDISVLGGAIPYQFEWSTGSLAEDIIGLCSGSYWITVSSFNEDTLIQEIVVTDPGEIAVSFGGTNVDPNTGLGGSIDAVISGGTSPFNYQWSDGSSTANIIGVDYGTYSVTITDANSCTGSGDYFVDFSLLPNWSFATGSNIHVIDLPATSVIQSYGGNLTINDFIGVFYDSLGTLVCGGYTIYDGFADSVITFLDDTASIEPDGFTTGAQFVWKIWDASLNSDYMAYAIYDQSFPSQEFFEVNGHSSIDTIQVLAISGNVSTAAKANLPSGKVIIYGGSPGNYNIAAHGTIDNGYYEVSGMLPGNYLVFAIPEPDFEYGLPGYFLGEDQWHYAFDVNIQGHTGNVNFELKPYIQANQGIGIIEGLVSVGSDASYNPDIYDSDWFPSSSLKNDAARNIPVILYDENYTPLNFDLTNEYGEFGFSELAMGTYFIRIEKAGLYADSVKIILSETSPDEEVNFLLNQGLVVLETYILSKTSLKVYPNPVNKRLNLVLEKSPHPYQITLFSTEGKHIISSSVTVNEESIHTIDLDNLSSGIYLLKITTESLLYTCKIIKQ
jgi:hypothetical protein